MSGLEVLGGITAVITIIEESIKIWQSVRKDLELPEAFEAVGNRLPILKDTLNICHEHFKPIASTLPADTAKGLSNTIQDCEGSATKLRVIFERTIPGEDEKWYERYRRAVRSLGKGSRVEELMQSIAENTQDLVNYHSVKSVKPELGTQLEEIVAEMKAAQPSLPDEDVPLQTFNALGGYQYVSTARSTQHNYVNTSSGPMNNFAGITGNVTFNQKLALPTPVAFTGTYSHFSWSPVASYVSRPELECRLEEQLPTIGTDHVKAMRTVVVWGLGGAGKSQLVLHYTDKHQSDWRNRFWIRAGSKQTLEHDYLQIYSFLFPHAAYQPNPPSIDSALTAVKDWLYGQRGRSLWVMDSADTIDDSQDSAFIDLDYYLPDSPQLDRIITTRISSAQDMSSQEGVEVKEMTIDEAARLFQTCAKLRRKGKEVEEEVIRIVGELGCLALAVTLAGTYVRETPRLAADIERYLPRYRAHRKQLLNQKAQKYLHRYDNSVLSTWEMSLDAIERRSPLAARLLTLIAFINYDDIFLELFTEASPYTSDDEACVRWTELLSPAGEETLDEFSVETSFALLHRYSLLSWQEAQEAYAMHKLVHAWSYDRLEADQQRLWSLATLEMLSQALEDNLDIPHVSRRLVPHVVANFATVSASCGSAYQITSRERQSLRRVGRALDSLGRWDDEYSVQLFLLQVTRVALRGERSDTLVNVSKLASIFEKQGNFTQASEMHRQVVTLSHKLLGREHSQTLISMNNLGLALIEQGQYEEAAKLHRQTIRLKQRTPDSEDPETLASMSNLALALRRQGKYAESEDLYRQGLEVSQRVLGPEHRSTVRIISDLAGVLGDQGKYEQAVELHWKEFELNQSTLGPWHPDTLTSKNNLGVALTYQGDYKQALTIQQSTLKMRQRVIGRKHRKTLVTMSNLALAHKRQGDFEEAVDLYRQTLELRQEVLGPGHPETLKSRIFLTEALRDQSQFEERKSVSKCNQHVFRSR